MLPRLAALGAALVGVVNVASALTPNIRWRGHLLLAVEPVEAMRLFHALALPAGAALLLVAPYLLKRRRRAWQAAIVLMLALGLFDLLKGLDFEETVITWAAAAVLVLGRGAFRGQARSDHVAVGALARAARRLGGLAVAAVVAWATEGHPSWRTVVARDRRPAAVAVGPIRFRHSSAPRLRVDPARRPPGRGRDAAGDRVRDLPPAGGAASAARRRARARGRGGSGPAPTATTRCRSSSCAPTSTTSSATSATAFVGYRIENGVLLLSGDPVGPDERSPDLLEQLQAFARGPRPEARRGRRQRAAVPAV